MSNPQHEGVRSQTYPEDETQITLDPSDLGMLDASFSQAIRDHGNDTRAIWPSYVDDEVFSVTYQGKGATLQEGCYWGVWLIAFEKEDKTLRLDIGGMSVERMESTEFVPGSFRDVSDIVAAFFNLEEYNYQMRLQSSLAPYVNEILDIDIKPIGLDDE